MTEPKPATPPSSNADPAAGKPSDRPGASSLSYIERVAREMADRRPRRASPAFGVRSSSAAVEPTILDAQLAEGSAASALAGRQMTSAAMPAASPSARAQPDGARPAFRPMFDDHFRLTLTAWQSAGISVAIAALVIGALGMAASGWVAAYHWSCRVGFATNYCAPAPTPALKPLALPEIPT